MGQQRDCKSTVERAFEVADIESVRSMEQLVKRLHAEGYSTSMLTGPLLLKQLRERLCANASRPVE